MDCADLAPAMIRCIIESPFVAAKTIPFGALGRFGGWSCAVHQKYRLSPRSGRRNAVIALLQLV
jgi:hypothetical protein